VLVFNKHSDFSKSGDGKFKVDYADGSGWLLAKFGDGWRIHHIDYKCLMENTGCLMLKRGRTGFCVQAGAVDISLLGEWSHNANI